MRDLYTRLSKVGFDSKWLRAVVLPDWWDDALAAIPFNRAAAEAAISGFLGIPLRALRDPGAALAKPTVTDVCFKRNRKTAVRELATALQVARQTAKIVASVVGNLPPFAWGQSAKHVRETILDSNPTVTLDGLVEYCWSRGIAVIGVTGFPKKAKRFDGVAMYEGIRPVVILSSNRDGPAWLAFHLAHELGHLMLGHVRPGDSAILDANLSAGVKDDTELEADEFALEVLTGSPVGILFERSGHKACEVGPLAVQFVRDQSLKIDPSVIVLIYCKSTDYWGVAQGALEAIGAAKGGQEVIATALANHLDFENLSDAETRFLSATCKLPTDAILT